MEPSTPLVGYSPHNSKKRVFSGSRSSLMDGAEIIDVDAAPSSRSSKSLKQKAVLQQEIIDIVDDENDSDDLMILGEKVVQRDKGKKALTTGQKGFNSNVASIDHYEDLWYDDECAMLQAHFDNLDVPAGIEASVPWWPQSSESKKQAISSSNSQYANFKSIKDDSLSTADQAKGGMHIEPPFTSKPLSTIKKKPFYASPFTGSYGQPGGWFPPQSFMPPLFKPAPFPAKFYSGPISSSLPNSSGAGAIKTTGHMFPGSNTFLGSDMDTFFEPEFMPYSANPSVRLEEGIAAGIKIPLDLASCEVGGTSESPILSKLEQFKKFETVDDYSDHYYANKKDNSRQPSKSWVKKIQEEWRILEKDMPDTIFVRVYETRMDLMRAVIVGAEGTPYHDGIFFFDIYFPATYPNVPPNVNYRSGGLRLNPNLYDCGKVCLSLLNTWSGDANQKWIPGKSTMLQVVVSIQGLILNAKPYFNEPGHSGSMGTAHGEMSSKHYNDNTLLLSLKTMLYSMNNPPKHFEDFVFGHYFKYAHDILGACRAYLDGAQVGSLVKGMVENGNAGKGVCSPTLKLNLPNYMKSLAEAFANIGVKDCEKFMVTVDEVKNTTGSRSTRKTSRPGVNLR